MHVRALLRLIGHEKVPEAILTLMDGSDARLDPARWGGTPQVGAYIEEQVSPLFLTAASVARATVQAGACKKRACKTPAPAAEDRAGACLVHQG